MNKKGFTLVELLAVIVILALLALITTTSVTKLVNDSKQELSDIQINLIKSAAQAWGADNIKKLPDTGECIYMTLDVLKQYGLLDSNIMNPINNREISDDLKIKITSEQSANGNSVLKYEVNPESISNCDWAYPCDYSKATDGSDMVTCGTENFYIIEKTEKHVIMLSKYNLTLTANPIQDTTGSNNPIFFSSSMYWRDATTLDLKIDQNHIQEGRKQPYVYGNYEGNNIYPYVEAYKNVLDEIGVDVFEAKLLDYDQAINLGCKNNDCSAAPSWVWSTSYWIGSASNSKEKAEWVLTIYSDIDQNKLFGWDYFNNPTISGGIRPVITIPTYVIEE